MTEPAIDILSQRLADSEIDPQLRDALADDLSWAAQINGTADPAMQGIKRMAISGVRRELLAASRDHKTQQQVGSIIDLCAKRHKLEAVGNKGDVVALSIEKFNCVVKTLTPWRWPLAIVCFSPHGVDMIKMAVKYFGG